MYIFCSELVSFLLSVTKKSWGIYYKTLQICNLHKMDIFCSEPVSFLLSFTNILPWINTPAYYGIRKLRVRNVFIVQAPGMQIIVYTLAKIALS